MMILIKNEMIKLFRRKKTYIVLIAFILLTAAICYGSFKMDENRKKYNNPEFKIKNLQESLNYMKRDKENVPQSIKDDANALEQYNKNIDANIERTENEINALKDAIASGSKEIDWRTQLKNEISAGEEQLKNSNIPDRYKAQQKLELSKKNYLLNNDIKPADEEFNGFNFVITLIRQLGSIFLAVGVIVFSTDIVSGECTPPTLKFLLIQPVSRTKVLLSKFISVVISAIVLIISVELLFMVIVGLWKGFGNANYPMFVDTLYQFDLSKVEGSGVHPLIQVAGSTHIITISQYLIRMFLLQILYIIACTSFAFLISSLFKSSMVSMGLSIVAVIALTVLVQGIPGLLKVAPFMFTSYGEITPLIDGTAAGAFQNPSITYTFGITVLIIWSVACYLISHFVFNKKDILI
ncbi:ABC transporter permease subunit [Clostridium sp. JN-9]|uniref:ABC transporter permease subunit n=1 Tax=Clostridium sp. JN-9 TaxID=2507159 RepID=UPI000FFE154E|nr:ABC transporter permease subunit [Clostridium sp. JN-9]QAT41103.1 ABC transporter permease [Clostridium sp. JN-9]